MARFTIPSGNSSPRLPLWSAPRCCACLRPSARSAHQSTRSGLQAHLKAGDEPHDHADLRHYLRAVTALGLPVLVTEINISDRRGLATAHLQPEGRLLPLDAQLRAKSFGRVLHSICEP